MYAFRIRKLVKEKMVRFILVMWDIAVEKEDVVLTITNYGVSFSINFIQSLLMVII